MKMNAHVEEPVAANPGCRADVPEQLATALERMLAKDRADRSSALPASSRPCSLLQPVPIW